MKNWKDDCIYAVVLALMWLLFIPALGFVIIVTGKLFTIGADFAFNLF